MILFLDQDSIKTNVIVIFENIVSGIVHQFKIF